jgi:hypothetical protein
MDQWADALIAISNRHIHVTRKMYYMIWTWQKLLTLPGHLSSPPVFNGVRVTRSLVLCVCFVDRCLSFCPFSFSLCVVCPPSIYGFSCSVRIGSCCSGKAYSIQHYVIKFVSDLRQVGGFQRALRFPPPRYNWNIVKHHQTNQCNCSLMSPILLLFTFSTL